MKPWCCIVIIMLAGVCSGVNVVKNSGFEEGIASWTSYSTDTCYITTSDVHSGSRSLKCINPGPKHKQQGYRQTIVLNQEVANAIVISGYSKSINVHGTIPIFYGVYAEVTYEDDSVAYESALFFEGTHEWTKSEKLIWSEEGKRITSLDLYVTFNNHTGTAWFDDINVVEYQIRPDYKLGLRILILSVSHDDILVEAAKSALDAVGASYHFLNALIIYSNLTWVYFHY